MEAADEPELPRLPLPEVEEGADAIQQDEFIHFGDQEDVVMGGGGYDIPSDPPIPPQLMQELERERKQEPEPEQQEQEGAMEDETSAGQAPARAQRQRRRPLLEPDDQTKITRQEIKSWSANYLDNAERASLPRNGVTITEARKNAFNLVFGRGIAGIGFATGLPEFTHPLAHHFAGEGLQARLLGIVIENADAEAELPRGRRRSALEALDLEDDDAERRVRRRLSEENDDSQLQSAQLPQHDDVLPHFGDDEDFPPVEVGRRAGSALPDIPSDLPWNRHSSQIPGSSIKAGGSRQVSASPLHNRSHGLAEVERFSDNQPAFGSDGLNPDFAPLLHSGGGGSAGHHDPFSDPILPQHPQSDTTSQAMRTALNGGGQSFLAHLSSIAQKEGAGSHGDDDDDDSGRQWIKFGSLFEHENRERATVVQAFYQVLSLATRNVLKVKQDGQGGTKPFGAIRLGLDVSAAATAGDDGVEAVEGVDTDEGEL
jgi:meiotic recombination protein REC8